MNISYITCIVYGFMYGFGFLFLCWAVGKALESVKNLVVSPGKEVE